MSLGYNSENTNGTGYTEAIVGVNSIESLGRLEQLSCDEFLSRKPDKRFLLRHNTLQLPEFGVNGYHTLTAYRRASDLPVTSFVSAYLSADLNTVHLVGGVRVVSSAGYYNPAYYIDSMIAYGAEHYEGIPFIPPDQTPEALTATLVNNFESRKKGIPGIGDASTLQPEQRSCLPDIYDLTDNLIRLSPNRKHVFIPYMNDNSGTGFDILRITNGLGENLLTWVLTRQLDGFKPLFAFYDWYETVGRKGELEHCVWMDGRKHAYVAPDSDLAQHYIDAVQIQLR